MSESCSYSNGVFDVPRLDQTIGKPGVWMFGNERDKEKMTIVSRLSRLENHVSDINYCLE